MQKIIILAPYTGINCSLTLSTSDSTNTSCVNNLCQNNSTCAVQNATSYICICPAAINIPGQAVQTGYTGQYCQTPVISPCFPNPCNPSNGGFCYTLNANTIYCFCSGILLYF